MPHQVRAIAHRRANPKGWTALEQGLGKTAVAIHAAQLPALVVCPAFLQHNWLDELAMWADGAKVQRVTRQIGYKPGADFYVQSYDISAGLVPPATVRTIIPDEGHYCKAPRAGRTKAVCRLAAKMQQVDILTGTPVPNRPVELWALASAIGMTRLNWREWGFHFCAGKLSHWGGYDFRGRSNVEELAELWQKWAFRLTKEECLTLPPKMRRLVVLDAPISARERDYDIDAIQRNPNPVAFIGLAEVLHEHGVRKVPLALEHIRNVLQSERPILIGAHHRDVLNTLHGELSGDFKVAGIHRGTPKG